MFNLVKTKNTIYPIEDFEIHSDYCSLAGPRGGKRCHAKIKAFSSKEIHALWCASRDKFLPYVFSMVVRVAYSRTKERAPIGDMVDWLQENTTGRWATENDYERFYFYFESSDDLALFKLWWENGF